MAIQLSRAELRQSLDQFTLALHGDRFERQFGHYLSESFPNCERFWRLFVVPQTHRLSAGDSNEVSRIRFRDGVAGDLKDIASAHYSMFMNLAYAHLHLDVRALFSLEAIYVHLASSCDLADCVLERWYNIQRECRGEKSRVLQRLSRDDFLEIAGEWYDNHYPDVYQRYISKGKFFPIKIPNADDLIHEYLVDSEYWRPYARVRQQIRTFRNLIVHDVRLGRIASRGGRYLVPKPEQILKGNYRSWREVEEAASEPDKIRKHFVEPFRQARTDMRKLEATLNDVWEKLIGDYEEEFDSPESVTLREKFDIEMSEKSTGLTVTVKELTAPSPDAGAGAATYVPRRGDRGQISSAGSATYHEVFDDED